MACNEMTTNGKKALIFYQIFSTRCSRKMYGDKTVELACGWVCTCRHAYSTHWNRAYNVFMTMCAGLSKRFQVAD